MDAALRLVGLYGTRGRHVTRKTIGAVGSNLVGGFEESVFQLGELREDGEKFVNKPHDRFFALDQCVETIENDRLGDETKYFGVFNKYNNMYGFSIDEFSDFIGISSTRQKSQSYAFFLSKSYSAHRSKISCFSI